jgi:zinc transport system ATP-binding protein
LTGERAAGRENRPDSSVILSCRNVGFSYNGKAAVEGVSIDVLQGDCLCIVGENGSGKTTLMRGLLGLLTPDAGRIEFRGLKRAEVGYMPQQTVVQKDFPASVREVVLSGCLNRHGFFPFYTRRDRVRADENLERLGIAAQARTAYRDLSGGQKQRVLLARALCSAGRLLMLDEPSAGLDPAMASGLYSLLEKLNRDGMTLLMISHDLKNALRCGNRILHMRGKPLFYGKTSEYVTTDVYRRMNGGDGSDGFD